MNRMNHEPTDHQLIEAEMKLARTLERLSALRRAALYGSYDATTFDQAVMEYRRAEEAVIDIRRAKSLAMMKPIGNAAPAPSETSAPVEPAEPLEVTPRLLFARWLVQTGRLSDWDDGVAERDGGVHAGTASPIVTPSMPARAAA